MPARHRPAHPAPPHPANKPAKLGEHPDWEYGAFVTNTPGGQVQFHGARWIGNYTQTVPLTLDRPVALDEITSVVLTTTFGGGIGGDNWNIDSLRISAAGKVLYQADGNPLVRFTGDNRPHIATIQ